MLCSVDIGNERRGESGKEGVKKGGTSKIGWGNIQQLTRDASADGTQRGWAQREDDD